MSLIADSLKKAIKEKCLNIAPGINLLKNLGSKSKPKFDLKEIKRFVFLIFIPATILAYLLLANPFGSNRNSQKTKPPVVAKAPPLKPAPKTVPSQPAPPVPPVLPTTPSVLPAKEPENIPLIGPGMSEVTVPEDGVEVFGPKPVPGPKKEPEETIAQEPTQEESIAMDSEVVDSEEKVKAETEPSMKINRADLAKAPIPKANKFSPPKRPGPDITKDSDHYFNQAIFYQQSRDWEKALKNYSKAEKLNVNNPDIYNNIGMIYKELRQFDQAIEEFLKAIDINPEYAKSYNNIGVVYYAKKISKEPLEIIRKRVQLILRIWRR